MTQDVYGLILVIKMQKQRRHQNITLTVSLASSEHLGLKNKINKEISHCTGQKMDELK